MNIIIIEDEIKTAKALAAIITAIKPSAKILASIQSVATAVRYFSENAPPELIFMDVQLADGDCFKIFESVKIVSPVVFCTAFNEYAVDAFRTNGIAYILKPFSYESISAAFEKVNLLQDFFQTLSPVNTAIESLLTKAGIGSRKKSFLVFNNNRYITVLTDNIAYFFIRNVTVTLVTFEQKEYTIPQSLDEVYNLLDETQFFRINRQYIINFSAIKEVEHYFARKLLVKLILPAPEKLLVPREKANVFLNWMEHR